MIRNLSFLVLLQMDKLKDKDTQFLIAILHLWVMLKRMNLEEVEY